MAQWVKYLVFKCEDHSSGPQNTHRMSVAVHLPSKHMGGRDREDPARGNGTLVPGSARTYLSISCESN